MGKLAGILSFVFLLTLSSVDSQQPALRSSVGSCFPVEIADLGNTTSRTTVGLVPAAFVGADGSDAPMVRILRHNIVCEVAGRLKNTIGETSVLVQYECLGTRCPGYDANSPSNVLTLTSQFQFQCRDTDMFPSTTGGVISGGGGSTRVDNTAADFMTAIARECGACVDPATGAIGNGGNDPVTFCGGMLTPSIILWHVIIFITSGCGVECNEGQMRCIGNDAPGLCCNWYLNNECYVTCPPPLIGDTETYDCGECEYYIIGGFHRQYNFPLQGGYPLFQGYGTLMCSSGSIVHIVPIKVVITSP